MRSLRRSLATAVVLCVASSCGDDGGDLAGGRFSGPDSDRLADHLPLVLPPAPGVEDFRSRDELGGMILSDRRVVMSFAAGVTVGEANRVLSTHGVRVVGASPLGLAVVDIPEPGIERILAISEALRAEPSVIAAAPDALMGLDSIPPPSDRAGWAWETEPRGENWGLELIRMPQAWSLEDYVRRTGDAPVVQVGVIDGGFSSHRDLTDRLNVLEVEAASTEPDDVSHGMHVSCIIGAAHGDRFGVDGVSDFVRITAVPKRSIGFLEVAWDAIWSHSKQPLSEIFIAQTRAILASPSPRIVSISSGYNWGRSVAADEPATALVREHGEVARCLAQNANGGSTDCAGATGETGEVLFAVSAGNDGGYASNPRASIDALWNSPWTYAALSASGSRDILVVEGVGGRVDTSSATWTTEPGVPVFDLASGRHQGSLWVSNVNGHVSAPGRAITSCDGAGGFHAEGGTSQATPYVSGLAAFLLALDPMLSNAELRVLLRGNTPLNPPEDPLFPFEVPSVTPVAPDSTFGTQPRPTIDAFAAALAIDLVRGGDRMQIALVDTDDGTADGNTRLRRTSEGRPFADVPCAPTSCDYQADARGDGVVDMRDFRRFRDAVLLVEGHGDRLDGSPMAIKRDLNRDGVVEAPASETFPRFDFNGDGRVDRDSTVSFPGQWADGGRRLTDLEVLQEVFGGRHAGADAELDAGGWAAEDLGALFTSVDVEVDLAPFFAEHPDAAAVQIRYRSLSDDRDPRGLSLDVLSGTRRTIQRADPSHSVVMTVPEAAGAYLLVNAYDAGARGLGIVDIATRFARHQEPVDEAIERTMPAPVGLRDELVDAYFLIGDVVRGQDYWIRFGTPPEPVAERIAYLRLIPGDTVTSGIYTVLSDGGDDRLLSNFEGARAGDSLACSRDGRFVVTAQSSGDCNVYRIDTDGTSAVRLTDADCTSGMTDPAIRPDDLAVALVRAGQVVELDLTTRTIRQLTTSGRWSSPTWSPDGSFLYLSDDARIFRLPAAGGTPEPITPERVTIDVGGVPIEVPVTANQPDAGPRSGRIALISNYGFVRELPPPPEAGAAEVLWIDAGAGSAFNDVTALSGSRFVKFWPTWSPDETRIAFAGDEGGADISSLYVTDVGGGAIRRVLTASGATIGTPCWIAASL